jgi:hypothetical protein
MFRVLTNANDRLSLASQARVESLDGVLETSDVADVRPQPVVPHSLDDLTQLRAIGFDDEVDRQAIPRARATYSASVPSRCQSERPTTR